MRRRRDSRQLAVARHRRSGLRLDEPRSRLTPGSTRMTSPSANLSPSLAMKKIPSLFERNYETDRLVRDEVVPGCEWVLAGEGKATVKFDGTSCLYKGGNWFKR